MKLTVTGCVIALIAMLYPFSTSSAQELDEHLQFLAPLLGKQWVGGFVEPEPRSDRKGSSEQPEIEIVLRFEKILEGHAVRYVREASAAHFSSLTHFFWNPGREEVRFTSFNNKGMVEEGVVLATDGVIVLQGKSYRPDGTIEFKTTLEIDPKGTLRDTFEHWEGNEWVQGHLQEFVVEE